MAYSASEKVVSRNSLRWCEHVERIKLSSWARRIVEVEVQGCELNVFSVATVSEQRMKEAGNAPNIVIWAWVKDGVV